jgi:hypothetical protein
LKYACYNKFVVTQGNCVQNNDIRERLWVTLVKEKLAQHHLR